MGEDPFVYIVVFLVGLFHPVAGPPHKEAAGGYKAHVEETAHDHKGFGHEKMSSQKRDEQTAQDQEQAHAADVGPYDGEHFFNAGVFPYPVIQFENIEAEGVAQHIHRHVHCQAGNVGRIAVAGVHETYDGCQPYGYADGHHVC